MAHRPRAYGLTAEVNSKIKSKYELEDEKKVLRWIAEVLTDRSMFDGVEGEEAVHQVLKDGLILCKVINMLYPGSVRKVNKMKQPFMMMENISAFLDACVAYGVRRGDLFQTVDLYEGQNMVSVIQGIFALGRKAQTNGYRGAVLGPKEASENHREFTYDQMNEGFNIIGLQMGSNKGANQSGVNFGKSRFIMD
ncbi:myophilin-like [Clytia hemisphaerica]|uniref:myophilin-like n=1 Tax=Clytia hemisphaerica TaxID=252671 RepID=UPI0034D77E10